MKLKIAVAQFEVAQSAPEQNIARVESMIADAVAGGAEFVCLPEMWTTGFDWGWIAGNAAAQQPVVDRILALAASHKVWLNGSVLMLNGSGQPANTSLLIDPSGTIKAAYRKVHLFGMFREQEHLAAGDELVMYDTPWGRVGLAVCYDLRFPELFRSYAIAGTTLLLCPAAFPTPRIDHWHTLLRARAIENQAYVIATNQCGTESLSKGEVVRYGGTSMVIDPWGEVIAEAGKTGQELLTAEIDLEKAATVRRRMSVLTDRRPDVYRLQ